jgi:hypothetical protein
MMTNIDALIKEIETSDMPVQLAVYVTGIMAGTICKHAKNTEYMAYMRMIVELFDQEREGPLDDTTAIDLLMDKLRERYHQRRNPNE